MEPLLGAKEAARLLGISRRTLGRKTQAGEIVAVKVGGRLKYEPEAIRAYIRANRTVVNAEDPEWWGAEEIDREEPDA